MYKRGVFPTISMALGTIDHDEVQTPIGMPPPQTWSELRLLMGELIGKHFPYAREAAISRERENEQGGFEAMERELQMAISTRESMSDETEVLPEDIQNQAANMLRAMFILQPEDAAHQVQNTQKNIGARVVTALKNIVAML